MHWPQRSAVGMLPALAIGAVTLAAPAGALAQNAADGGGDVLLHDGRLIEGVSARARGPVTVRVREGRIVAVGDGYAEPREGDQVIDLRDHTLMRGLMDMHTHLTSEFGPQSYVEPFRLNPADIVTATGGVLSVASSGDNPQFMDDELADIVATARDYGFQVAAHAHGRDGMLRAVLAGVDSIEHGTYMDDEVMEAMKRQGTWYVPTIIAGRWVGEQAEIDGFFPEVVRIKARTIGPLIQNTFARAYRSGVNIVFGTDTGVSPHGDNHREFSLMVEAGMPPMEAIQSALGGGAFSRDR